MDLYPDEFMVTLPQMAGMRPDEERPVVVLGAIVGMAPTGSDTCYVMLQGGHTIHVVATITETLTDLSAQLAAQTDALDGAAGNLADHERGHDA